MKCPHCQSEKVVKNGRDYHQDGKAIQNYLCKGCGKRFNERTGTAMSRLRTPANIVSYALKMRTEGMGIRASGRILEKSHTSIMRWEQKLANQAEQWSPEAPVGGDVTIEGDEIYTRVGENLPPQWIKRMDSSIYRTQQSLLDWSKSRKQNHWPICQSNTNSMAMVKGKSIHPMVYWWRKEICPTTMANGKCIPQI